MDKNKGGKPRSRKKQKELHTKILQIYNGHSTFNMQFCESGGRNKREKQETKDRCCYLDSYSQKNGR